MSSLKNIKEQIEALNDYLTAKVENFSAGQLSNHLEEWENYTSDPEILQIVLGDTIKFNHDFYYQHFCKNANFTLVEEAFVSTEIQKLISKGVIVQCEPEEKEFVSPIFTVPKTDGGRRFILNLKNLNKNVEFKHFKMDTIKTVLENITPKCYMASMDLKDAYYSVRIDEKYQRFLKFSFDGRLYKFTCYPNGLGPCPRKFTKLNKPLLCYLRQKGHFVVEFIDDFFLQGQTYNECEKGVIKSIKLFDGVGYVIHPIKSHLIPSNEITYLGFVINSIDMTVEITQEKKDDILSFAVTLIESFQISIRQLAGFIGKIVATFPGSTYGPLHYRCLESYKTACLRENKGNFDAKIRLTPECKIECSWWRDKVMDMKKSIDLPPFDHEIYTDASKTGWGAVFSNKKLSGHWDFVEDVHINVLEMQAILNTITKFTKYIKNSHIKVYCDNVTAVSTINKMGTSHSTNCNKLGQLIWEYCIENCIWITSTFIPGKENIEADALSRKLYKNAEAMLNRELFNEGIKQLNFMPDLDCFASPSNAQIDRFVCRFPKKNSFATDAFTVDWSKYKCYLFPPFSLIGRVLQKIRRDKPRRVLMVVPRWPTQAWYPMLERLMIQPPFNIKPQKANMFVGKGVHPMAHKIPLMMCLLSGLHT